MEREMMIVNSDRDRAYIIGAGTEISISYDDGGYFFLKLKSTIMGKIECYEMRERYADPDDVERALTDLIDAYKDGAAVYVMPAPIESDGES